MFTISLFFFFQAEDGIRDKLVTGVQTCALRLHLGLEIEHQAHDARAVVRDAQALDIRIVRRDFGVQLEERGRQLGELEVEHQALGVLDAEQRELDLIPGFEGQARVVARRPDAAGEDLCFSARYARDKKDNSQSSPARECDCNLARRPSPANSRARSRSGGASRVPARSGHSTRQTESALKYSRKPELNHSVRSLNR